jgi:peptidyl-prolyl cis-trans isomerase A (cyclophilin A)
VRTDEARLGRRLAARANRFPDPRPFPKEQMRVKKTHRFGLTAAPLLTLWLVACGGGGLNRALWEPTPEMLAAPAPDSFLVAIETSEGTFDVVMHRAWSPQGVDRMYHLMSHDFYTGARIYRVVPGFVAQWGFSGDPVLDSLWRDRPIDDEPTVASNLRGTISYARAGERTRSYTLFVNLADNVRLDDVMAGGVAGYPPIGRIERGLDVIDGFYPGYTEDPPMQDSIQILGNEYMRRKYPQLDSIVGTRVIREWR